MSKVIIRIEDGTDGSVTIIPVWRPSITDVEDSTLAQRMALEVLTYLNNKHEKEASNES
tara:strand:+ start:390 stop:566 length:177 start_codon:yes stop_codon:yes gene_type:complete